MRGWGRLLWTNSDENLAGDRFDEFIIDEETWVKKVSNLCIDGQLRKEVPNGWWIFLPLGAMRSLNSGRDIIVDTPEEICRKGTRNNDQFWGIELSVWKSGEEATLRTTSFHDTVIQNQY